MVSKKTKTEFYFSQLKRIAKNEKIKVKNDAVLALAEHLEKHTKTILKRAQFFASKKRKKTISREEIEEATKEGVLAL
jgi:histone H3/H4